jgi:hypothetical protein
VRARITAPTRPWVLSALWISTARLRAHDPEDRILESTTVSEDLLGGAE